MYDFRMLYVRHVGKNKLGRQLIFFWVKLKKHKHTHTHKITHIIEETLLKYSGILTERPLSWNTTLYKTIFLKQRYPKPRRWTCLKTGIGSWERDHKMKVEGG